MKKQELVHMHGLVAMLANACEEDGIDFDQEEYDAMGIAPTSIHRSKGDHKEAVFALLNSVTSSIGDKTMRTADAEPATAD